MPAVESLVEEIDVGGPTLVRAAAKNFRDVVVVVDPGDYPEALEAVRRAPADRTRTSGWRSPARRSCTSARTTRAIAADAGRGGGGGRPVHP